MPSRTIEINSPRSAELASFQRQTSGAWTALDVTFISALGPGPFKVRNRQAVTLEQFTAWIEKRNEFTENIVNKVMALRKFNGRFVQREALWPTAYDIAV